MLFKSPDTLVLRQNGGHGLLLINQGNQQTLPIEGQAADFWTTWEVEALGEGDHAGLAQQLVSNGLAIQGGSLPKQSGVSECIEDQVPAIAGKHVKWYAESPDLHILFNTQRMPQKNPLLVLGPYGSLCWRGVTQGWTIGRLRRESSRIFGINEVDSYLKRLEQLGFVNQLRGFSHISQAPDRATKEFYAPVIQFRLRQALMPWYCLWELCTMCDLRCQVCYQSQFSSRGPTTNEALNLAQQLAEAGIFYISIMGGEPLLRSDLEQIVEVLRHNGVFVKLISNGQRLSQGRAESLARAGLNQIEISFDGLGRRSHEGSRGPGTFRLVRQAIKNAKEAGIPRIGMVWTIHSGNLDELSTLPGFMVELGLQECYLSPFKKTGLNGSLAPYRPPNAHELKQIRHQLRAWQMAHPSLTIALLPSCSCGRTSVVIGDTGDVRLCSFAYHSVGNVYEKPLLEIWQTLESSRPAGDPLGYCAAVKVAI